MLKCILVLILVNTDILLPGVILHLLSREGLREKGRKGTRKRESRSGPGNQTLLEHVLQMKYQTLVDVWLWWESVTHTPCGPVVQMLSKSSYLM